MSFLTLIRELGRLIPHSRDGLPCYSILSVKSWCARVTLAKSLVTYYLRSTLRELNCGWNPVVLRAQQARLQSSLSQALEREKYWCARLEEKERLIQKLAPFQIELDKYAYGFPHPALLRVTTHVDLRLLRFCGGNSERLRALGWLSRHLADDVFYRLVKHQAEQATTIP